ncbi:hypothetical protein MATR_24980 [Marivirga tractuosa]|nr:hypothetical protein [Marivirga tractuosa]BDD15673.1 hypothetical protein MATR_24980 [Marivirga tractuosa]
MLVVFSTQRIQAQQTESQDQNPRLKDSSGISLYGIGPNAIGSVSYDRFLTPHLNAEAGIGFIGVHIGMKVHLWGGSERNWTPYIGAAVARSLFPAVGLEFLPYFPIGIQFVGANHFNFAFEIAPLQLEFLAWNVVGVKFGYRW